MEGDLDCKAKVHYFYSFQVTQVIYDHIGGIQVSVDEVEAVNMPNSHKDPFHNDSAFLIGELLSPPSRGVSVRGGHATLLD